MNAPTLWDEVVAAEMWKERGTHVVSQHLPKPKARVSDPSTSHEAAVSVKPSRKALVEAIREAVRWGESILAAPSTAFEIARRVEACHPRRWDEGTIRTAVSAAGLRAVDTEGRSPRGQRCLRYSL